MLYILRLWAQLARRANNVCVVCDIASTPLCGPLSHQQGQVGRAPGGQCRGRAGSDCGTTSLQQFRDAPARAAPPTLPQTGVPAGSLHDFTAASMLSCHTRLLAAIRHGRGAGSALTSQPPCRSAGETYAHRRQDDRSHRSPPRSCIATGSCSEYVAGQAARGPRTPPQTALRARRPGRMATCAGRSRPWAACTAWHWGPGSAPAAASPAAQLHGLTASLAIMLPSARQ